MQSIAHFTLNILKTVVAIYPNKGISRFWHCFFNCHVVYRIANIELAFVSFRGMPVFLVDTANNLY